MSLIKLPWDEFKTMYRLKKIPFQSRETENAFVVTMPERTLQWITHIFKENDPRYEAAIYEDWITNFKPLTNMPVDPRSDDGRVLTQPVTLDKGIWHWFCGRGDDPEAGKAEGQRFQARLSAPNTSETVSWGFNDWITLSGGVVRFRGANLGDCCDFTMHCPASVAVPNEASSGNCHKVPTGLGFSIIVPASGDGAFDINLETDAYPIPNEQKKGYWDWSWPDTGRGTFYPRPGDGHYDLYDAPLPMVRFIAHVPLLGMGTMSFDPQNPHPTYILPHWQMHCVVHRGPEEGTLEMVWHMLAGRKKTT